MKVKFFKRGNTSALESIVNNWLKDNEHITIYDSDLTTVNKDNNTVSYIYTIRYEKHD